MSYKDKITTRKVVSDGDVSGIFGVGMFGSTWGEITSVKINQEGTLTEIETAEKLLAVLLSKGRHTLEMEVKLNKEADPPGLFDMIAFPIEGIQGRVTGNPSLSFTDGDFATYSMTATSWHGFTKNKGAGVLTTELTSADGGLTTIGEATETPVS